jgi:hypothetical protein
MGSTRWAPLVVALLLAAGCQTNVTVAFVQASDGSGSVTVGLLMDRAAAEAAGDLRSALRVDDLQSAGWQVAGPVPKPPGGFVEFSVSKAFRNSGEAQLVLDELTGSEGPMSGLVADRTRSPLRIVSSLRGEVDFAKGYEAFGDPILAEHFQSPSQLGVKEEDIQAKYGKPLAELMPITLTVAYGDGVPQKFPLVPGQRIAVDARSVMWNWLVLFPMAAAGLGFVALVGSFARRRR